MRYSTETLKKYSAMMKEKINEYMKKKDDLHVSFSTGNMKIGKVLNVSTASGLCCGNCKKCIEFCYDIKAAMRFTNVANARAINTVIAMEDRERFFAEIDKKMKARKKNLYFRYHQGGEIIDYEYFCEMVETAKNNPQYKAIWTYTKCYWIVNRYVKEHGNSREKAIPKNMFIMFSEWDGVEIDNPFDFPIFTVKLANGNKNHPESFFENLWKCPGNCDICKKVKRGCLVGESTYANEH